MKIILDDYILLEKNIISICTSIEKYIDLIDQLVFDGIVQISPKSQAGLNNYLSLQASQPGSVFIGLFYSTDPLEFDIHVCWSLLRTQKEYQIFLEAMMDGSIFDMSSQSQFEERSAGMDIDTTIIDSVSDVEYLPDESDEYDLELEVDLDDTFLDDEDD